jgi:predicted metal-dependent phosphoesterase TrpH
MRVDLHIHTRPRSSCSAIEPAELADAARKAGLDAICLTEHQNPWDRAEIEALARNGGIRVFQGNEITTNQGDILVFGCDVNVRGVVAVQDLRREVDMAGGVMIAAHPFRGFLLFGITQLQLDVEQASKRTVFQYVDGVEILNCKVTQPENDMARKVAERLGLFGAAGSDAHRLEEVGRCVTVFQREVQTERELVEELRSGRFTVEYVKR